MAWRCKGAVGRGTCFKMNFSNFDRTRRAFNSWSLRFSAALWNRHHEISLHVNFILSTTFSNAIWWMNIFCDVIWFEIHQNNIKWRQINNGWVMIWNSRTLPEPMLTKINIAIHIVRELTRVPMHPWSSMSGTILFRGLSGIILAMLPEKRGLPNIFSHFSKWPPQNLRFPISRKLLHVGSWIGESKPMFSWPRNQINTLYSMTDRYYMCNRKKKHEKIQDGHQFHTLFR